MKLKLKEDPKEWRKITLQSAVALVVISSLLRWRHRLPVNTWIMALIILAVIMISAALQPRWFRGYYRASSRLGFWLSQSIGRLVLLIIFFLVITPLGLVLRLCGKDPLRLKRPPNADSYWHKTKTASPLDRMF